MIYQRYHKKSVIYPRHTPVQKPQIIHNQVIKAWHNY